MNDISKHIQIRTPARVCLFGDHQDYLGLPIIAGAINRFLQFHATSNNEDYLEIIMPDIQSTRYIYLNEIHKHKTNEIDFLLAGLRVVERVGCVPKNGLKVTISGTIPINAGVSSSSAFTVGWIHLLLGCFGASKKINSELIAQLAYEAEVLEHNSPGGKMDQYTIALGGLIYLETKEPTTFQLFTPKLKGLILAESGISKETISTLRNVRNMAQEAIQKVHESNKGFNLNNCTVSQATVYSKELPEELVPFFMAAIENHAITKEAFTEFQQEVWNHEKLGKLMYNHQIVLRDRLQVSHPTIDKMIEAAMNADAYGGKIVGSGGGGCAVILAEEKKVAQVVEALMKAGAKAAYPIHLTEGSVIQKT